MPLLLLLLIGNCRAMPPDWNPPSLPSGGSGGIGGSPLAAASRCVPIPNSLELCANIGYVEMRLPNMLNHDSIAEVRDHTKQWLPLTRTECHRDLRILLCSVYAPVCIHQLPDKQIKPCRSLCEAVRQPCAAVMQGFGFAWPEMLSCSQFPPDSDLMCIKSTISSTAECRTCPEKVTYESIIGNFCINKVVLKARVDVLAPDASAPATTGASAAAATATTRLRLRGRVRYFKTEDDSAGVGGRRQLRSAVVDTAGCRCSPLEGRSSGSRKKFLLMGSINPDGTLSVGFLAEWNRENRKFRRAIRQIRRSQRRNRRRGGVGLCRGGAAGAGVDEAGRGADRRLPAVLPQPTTEVDNRGGGGRGGRKRGKKRNNNKKTKKRNRGKRGGKRKKKNRRNGGGGQAGRKNRERPAGGAAARDQRPRRGRRGRRQRRNRQRNRALATPPPRPPPLPPGPPSRPPQPSGSNRYSYDSFYYSDYKT